MDVSLDCVSDGKLDGTVDTTLDGVLDGTSDDWDGFIDYEGDNVMFAIGNGVTNGQAIFRPGV